MAEDDAVVAEKDAPFSNSCCAEWKDRYTKLQQKHSKLEERRNALRACVGLLKQQVDQIESDNINLKKAHEEERVRADNEKEEKLKESAIRLSLEDEISDLKSEVLSLQQKNSVCQDVDGEVTVVRLRISEMEIEMDKLKDLHEKEGIRADSEKKKAEAEKKKANEASKIVKAEKSRADEERRLADVERKIAEEIRLQLDSLKHEANEARSKLSSELVKFEEANKNLVIEKQNTIKEKKRADLEMAKAEEQRKLAEMNWKKAMDEKCRADELSKQLEQDDQMIEKLKEEIVGLVSSKKLVDLPADLTDKPMDAENEKAGVQSETLKRQHNSLTLGLENINSEDINKKIEDVKQKATREKKRAKSEMRKVEEQRKVAEAYRKKAMEEKLHADQLAKELEDNRHKIEGLHKEIHNLVSCRTLVKPLVVAPDKRMSAETAKEMKLVKKQLKFEKQRVKHAKKVAKLEKDRNTILQLELCCLKQEFDQFSQRLVALDNCFSHSNQDIDDMTKIGNVSHMKRKLFGKEACQIQVHNGHKFLKPSSAGTPTMVSYVPFKEAIECTAPLLPKTGGSCAESISGIDSKLEHLLRGSNRNIFQSSAINSSTASFSDRPLVGSQERGAFSISASAKLTEKKSNPPPTKSRLTGDATKIKYNEALAVVAENSVRSPAHTNSAGKTAPNKKRKRIFDAAESIEHLYTEGHKWYRQITEKLSMLHGMLNSQIRNPLEGERRLEPSLPENVYDELDRSQKNRKTSSEEEEGLWHLHNSNEQNVRLGIEGIEEANVCTQDFPPSYNLTGNSQACKDAPLDYLRSNQEMSRSFDEILESDYMKLLDLDNHVDEECYQTAIKMPLSPLPEIDFQCSETLKMGNSKPLVDECFYEEFKNVNDNLVPRYNFDVINIEIDSNELEINSSSHIPSLQRNEGVIDSFDNLADDDNGNVSLTGNEGPTILRKNRPAFTRDNLLKFYAVFPDTNDSGSISRIFHAMGSCMAQCFMISQTYGLVRNILMAVLKAEDLLPREKVCVFFSLLLNSFSGIGLENVRNFSDGGSVLLHSFAGYMSTALSDSKTRSMFVELCPLDELLTFIEDFLIDRRVLTHGDVSSESIPTGNSRVNIVTDSGNIVLFIQMASTQQLVAGSIILASICAAVDHVGFLCEASYNILRWRKFDSSLTLTILHVFAHVCGSKYFILDDFSLVMTVIKSLVALLERKNSATDSCHLSSLPGALSSIVCPFSEGTVSVDCVTLLLLEKLQNYVLSFTLHKDQMDLVNFSNSGALSHEEKTQTPSSHREGYVSCCLNNGNLCPFSDVLSLLELVACNTTWDWTFDNIVCQLFNIVDSSGLEKFSAAIVILLGQLGRFGVDDHGYENTGIENLRSKLTTFLDESNSRKLGLPIQIATVTALLGLLSLEFEDLIKSDVELPVVASQSNSANCIRKWFSLLSSEQQLLVRTSTTCYRTPLQN